MNRPRPRFALIAGGLVILYLLSVGPAYRMATFGVISNKFFVAAYEPVIYVGESVPFVRGVFNWYMRLWHDYRGRLPEPAP